MWGKQSYNHVNTIHNISLKNIFIVGTPRYENFFKLRNSKIKSHYKHNYILYLEGTWPRENISLKYLDKIINKNKKFEKLKIVYRPHPWRKSRDTINLKNYKNLIIDKQMVNTYKKKIFSIKSQPDLNYYPSLIKNAEFVIAGPTTMVIESLIFKKKILLLAFKESNHIYSPHNLYNYFQHFSGINKFKNIVVNKDLKNLENDLIKLNLNKNSEKNIDLKRNYYLYRDKNGYKVRLSNVIKNLLSKD